MKKRYVFNKRTGKIEEKGGPSIGRIIVGILLVICILGLVAWGIKSCNESNIYSGNSNKVPTIVDDDTIPALEEEIQVVEEVIPPFKFEALSYFKSSEHAEVEIKVDFPIGESVVADSVRKHLNALLGDKYSGNLQKGQEILNFYGNKEFRELEDEHRGIIENVENSDGEQLEVSAFESKTEVKVYCMEERYVTYVGEFYIWTGGAHGMGGELGLTFSKRDGRQIDYSFFKNLESGKFKQMLKEGLKKYFKDNDWDATDDEQFAERLMNVKDVNDIPLPGADPYFTPKGIKFIYGSYEIAAYAAGYPSFILPYEDAKPYLSEEALSLIE